MNQTTTWNDANRHHDSFRDVARSYLQLTKPRIIPLLLIETAAAMWVAAQGKVDPVLLLVTLLSGTLAAASAQTINCVYDRDIDFVDRLDEQEAHAIDLSLQVVSKYGMH